MRKIIIPLFLTFILSCRSVNIHTSPDQIPLFGDAELIRYNLAAKTEVFDFRYLKDKSTRMSKLREIEKLSGQGLEYFKANKITLQQYVEFTELARIGTQLILWFSLIESQNESAGISDIPDKEELQHVLQNEPILKQFGLIMTTNEEDPLLKLITDVLESLKAKLPQ